MTYLYVLKGLYPRYNENITPSFCNNDITAHIFEFVSHITTHFIDRHCDTYCDIKDISNVELIRNETKSISLNECAKKIKEKKLFLRNFFSRIISDANEKYRSILNIIRSDEHIEKLQLDNNEIDDNENKRDNNDLIIKIVNKNNIIKVIRRKKNLKVNDIFVVQILCHKHIKICYYLLFKQ